MNNYIRTAALFIVFSMVLSFSAFAQSEIQWGEPVGNFVTGIEVDPAAPLKLSGHLKYQGKEKALTQITESTLDWKVIFISDSKEQPISYKAEDTIWWDSYPHHREIDFASQPEHKLSFDFSEKKWIFHAYDPTKDEILTDVPQQPTLPAGIYKVQLECKGIESLMPTVPGKATECPKSGLQNITVK